MKVLYELGGAPVSGLLVLPGSAASLRLKFETVETDGPLPARCVGLDSSR